MPLFSIIIAVYNDWTALPACLSSLNQQKRETDFEVILVDDGSEEPAPEKIRQWSHCLPLAIERQTHKGISAARNRGIQISKGSLLLFVDADSRLQINCLTTLKSAIAALPQENYFQLHLIGDCSRFVGRTEHLRLTMLQEHLLQPNGSIRYLNTAGFAIRRSSVPSDGDLFNPAAIRAEDTLLLATLIQRGELPFFVPDAVVQHMVPSSLLKCLRKDVRSAYLEGGTYALIAYKGIKIRMSQRERWHMLWLMWKTAKIASVGWLACFGLILRQTLSRATSLIYRLLHTRSASSSTNPASLNGAL
ncbi:MAG TPA: glycosyltransferase family 2 protein [Terriglobales bacterium]|jgi:glycosyltransferase involved in cell wall biosynthesis|nr:glycosyltransferase family 2 protein [Terriglobales bacterium]